LAGLRRLESAHGSAEPIAFGTLENPRREQVWNNFRVTRHPDLINLHRRVDDSVVH